MLVLVGLNRKLQGSWRSSHPFANRTSFNSIGVKLVLRDINFNLHTRSARQMAVLTYHAHSRPRARRTNLLRARQLCPVR
eukprot:4872521-Pleurochrysis_carterae.AAC.2